MGDYKESWGVVTGTLLPFMGNNAPNGYLICDGTEYNIADYERLADHFEAEFGTKNHFGGDGTTTFKVPDLRGEFLRGTGTNSHSGEGSGSDVGVHQEGTLTATAFVNGYHNLILSRSDSENYPHYTDSVKNTLNASYLSNVQDGTNTPVSMYTSRPTNTSVLYIIKT
jgi:microcystin-dependent protein